MKWEHPEIGDERVVRKFLLLPRRIDNQTRWFTWSRIRQSFEMETFWTGGPHPSWYQKPCWMDLCWED